MNPLCELMQHAARFVFPNNSKFPWWEVWGIKKLKLICSFVLLMCFWWMTPAIANLCDNHIEFSCGCSTIKLTLHFASWMVLMWSGSNSRKFRVCISSNFIQLWYDSEESEQAETVSCKSLVFRSGNLNPARDWQQKSLQKWLEITIGIGCWWRSVCSFLFVFYLF